MMFVNVCLMLRVRKDILSPKPSMSLVPFAIDGYGVTLNERMEDVSNFAMCRQYIRDGEFGQLMLQADAYHRRRWAWFGRSMLDADFEPFTIKFLEETKFGKTKGTISKRFYGQWSLSQFRSSSL
jgi:hypothetical protein